MSENQSQKIYNVVNNWLETVKRKDPKEISDLYSEQAVLLGTVAENVKQGRSVIKTYFDMFVKKEPVGVLNSIIFKSLGEKYGVADGNYTFTLNDPDSETGRINIPARFTFVIDLERRLIETHHSSSNPGNLLTDI